ncbi:unnamed protein product [Leptosia nina]|uniref:Uncharacterized protein n=1 Tax=Leptosia nina TaxID=320188 RepID=A0AAV1J2K5_9NEOP
MFVKKFKTNKVKKNPASQSKEQDFIVQQMEDYGSDENKLDVGTICKKLKGAIKEESIKEYKNFLHLLQLVEDKTSIREYICEHDIDLLCLISRGSNMEMLEYLIEQTELLPYLFTHPDEVKRHSSIKMTCFNCMCNGNIGMLEKLYDLWVGNLHWVINKANEVDLENLKFLGEVINAAYIEYKEYVNKERFEFDPNIFVGSLCVITFNEFQIELYKNFIKEKTDFKNLQKDMVSTPDSSSRLREIEIIIQFIESCVDLHSKYCHKTLNKRFPELSILDQNDYTVYRTAQKFFMFRNLFWKTDYNVSLLILDNLYLLKERLKLSGKIYQELESKLYYFIYNCKSKWSFFLSHTEVAEVGEIVAENNGILHVLNTSFDFDMGALWTFLILYLERERFLKILSSFKEQIRKEFQEKNVRLNRTEMTHDEQQSLLPYPELRDDFSLRKIYQCLQELPQAKETKVNPERSFLIIERILQVVGEFIKSSKESQHLEDTTQALILSEIPIDLLKSLKLIRLYLSKSDSCQVLWRMEVLKHGAHIFEKVLLDLLQFKDVIKRVININRYLVNRSLINCCYDVIHDRKEKIKADIAHLMDNITFDVCALGIGEVLRAPTEFDGNIFLQIMYKSHWKPKGVSQDLMMEVAQIRYDQTMLLKKKHHEMQRIQKFIKSNYSHYKRKIKSLVEGIEAHKTRWAILKNEYLKYNNTIVLPDFPSEDGINIVQTNLKFVNDNDKLKHLSDLLSSIVDINPLWEVIVKLLNFLTVKSKVFDDVLAELKMSMISGAYKQLCRHGYESDSISDDVNHLFAVLENTQLVEIKPLVYDEYKYEGIKELEKILFTKSFITGDEMDYIIKNIPDSMSHKVPKSFLTSNLLLRMDNHIKALIDIGPFDKISENIIQSINVKNRNPDLLKCYTKRLESLSSLLNGQPKNLLILRYKLIGQFRIFLQMLLIDLFNIMNMCNMDESLKKGGKSMAEINLRHVLTHGNPLLEIVADFLDANDIPEEIIGKALKYSRDLKAVQTLCELKQSEFDFDDIHHSLDSFSDDIVKKRIKTLRETDEWERYLLLLPDDKIQKKRHKTKKKNKPKQVKQETELIKAVKEKETIEKILELVKGSNINAADKLGKAAIHYAAIQGDVKILQVLQENGADINLSNEKDNDFTALHYAARKSFIGAIDYLLASNAAIKKDKNGYTYIDIINSQRAKSEMRQRDSTK